MLEPIFELISSGDFDEATRQLDARLADDDAEPVLAYQGEFLRGFIFHRQKQYSQAREHFTRATELHPDYHPPHHFGAFADYYLGDLSRARAGFERHLELRPGEADDHFGIGLCDLDEGDLDGAEQHFEQAVVLHREAAARGADRRREIGSSLARLGDVHEQRGDLETARRAYEQALQSWPPHHEAWSKLHRVLVRLGETDLAAIALEQHGQWLAHARREGGE